MCIVCEKYADENEESVIAISVFWSFQWEASDRLGSTAV